MKREIIDGNIYTLYESHEEFEKDLPNIVKISVANMTKFLGKPLAERLKEMEDKKMTKKNIWDMNEKELNSIPKYPCEKLPVVVQSIYFKANRRKHESGYSCMTSYALIEDEYYKIGEYHDVIDIEEPIRIDCNPKNHLFHIWSWQGDLKIKNALSTLYFEVVRR